jgi:hypothetical protein
MYIAVGVFIGLIISLVLGAWLTQGELPPTKAGGFRFQRQNLQKCCHSVEVLTPPA